MKVTIRLFALFRDIVGRSEVEIEVPKGGTVREAWQQLKGEHGRLEGAARSVLFAVNKEIVGPDFSLKEGDEVAFLPPVSGGGGVQDYY